MVPEKKNSKLEELQESLYDPNNSPKGNARRIIHEKSFDVPDAWNNQGATFSDEEIHPEERTVHSKKLPLFVLAFSLVLCVIAALFAWFRLSADTDVVTQNLIAFESEAPQFIDGGEPFDYVVSFSNQNTSELELVDLEVSYPQGVEENESARIIITKDIGTVLPNAVLQEKFSLTLYGIPGTTKPITTTLRYSIPGSTATFEKKETKIVEIKSSPLALSVESLKEVTPGQLLKTKIRIESTRGKTTPNSLLQVTYPTGFEFVSADVAPSSGTNIWDLGTLSPGVVREITISGIPRGEDSESRTIRAQVGTKDATGLSIAAVFAEAKAVYVLSKPFLQTNILVNNIRSATHSVSSNGDVNVTIAYKNNLDKKLQNAEIALSLEGSAILEETIRVRNGFYDSRTNIVTWSKSGVPELSELEPGATGNLIVLFKTKNSSSLDTNEEIRLEVGAKARRIGETQISETVLGSQTTLLRVATRIALTAETARSGGAFVVFGPVPPRSEQETSYVLTSRVLNTVNPIDKGEVRFKLPANVRFIGGSASQGTVSYSEFDREIKWEVGSVVKSGSDNNPTMYVHVGMTPSLVNVGSEAILATDFALTATDTFTKNSLTAKGPSVLTTKFRISDGFREDDDLIVH